MQTPSKTYFSQHPILRTRDLDEARFKVSQRFCEHRLDLHRGGAPLSVTHNAVRGPNMSLNYLSYGAEVAVEPGLFESFYMFQIPLNGAACVEHRNEEMIANRHAGSLLNPDRQVRLHWGPRCSQLLFQIDRRKLETVAQSLTGAPLPGPIRFDMKVDFTKPEGRRLQRIFKACAHAVEHQTLFQQCTTGSDLRIEYDLTVALLTLQSSNVSHIIARADTGSAPRTVRRALEYIHTNFRDAMTVSDIARAAGVNVRTLQKAFQRSFDKTPMQVLRDARLDAAHYMLLARFRPFSVTEAASSCGFSHLGRFSAHYRARFGRSPGERY